MNRRGMLGMLALLSGCVAHAPRALEPVTSLENAGVRYRVADGPYVVLRRGPVEAVIADNSAVDDAVLSKHRRGYHGVASLKHTGRAENVFVPTVSGLNFEHIFDGRMPNGGGAEKLYEPRYAPMELRVVNAHTAELYQRATPTYRLESCARYELLEDGTIEMTFECVPRAAVFGSGYMGMFWASYIHEPESPDIHFIGREAGERGGAAGWVRGVTPMHGIDAVHPGVEDARHFPHEPAFAERLRLVFGLSKLRYAAPWYYGVSHGMAVAMVFREGDAVRFTQSPSGGGKGNPAWDFQWYLRPYEVGRRYRLVMRMVYMPYESPEQVRGAVERQVRELNAWGRR